MMTGGDKLAKVLEHISVKTAEPRTLRVGFLEGATYPDGTSVPMVAAVQEFGAPNKKIPPRPFFRNMIKAKSPKWGEAVAGLLKSHDMDAGKAFALMGEGISGQLRESIIDTLAPPLSPITLMLRKMKAENPDLVVNGRVVAQAAVRVAKGESYAGASTKPLVETGHLLNSVGYEVVGQ